MMFPDLHLRLRCAASHVKTLAAWLDDLPSLPAAFTASRAKGQRLGG
jgi:hypothetical protein